MVDLPQAHIDSKNQVDEVVEQDVQLGLDEGADRLPACFRPAFGAVGF